MPGPPLAQPGATQQPRDNLARPTKVTLPARGIRLAAWPFLEATIIKGTQIHLKFMAIIIEGTSIRLNLVAAIVEGT